VQYCGLDVIPEIPPATVLKFVRAGMYVLVTLIVTVMDAKFNTQENSWCSKKEDRRTLLSDISSLHKSGDYSNFRKIHSLCAGVSGANHDRAKGELDYILKNNPSIITNNLDKILECDSFGNPPLHTFPNKILTIKCSDSISPPLYDLTKLTENFGSLPSNLSIIEIGCGFGIETKIFHDLVGYKSYTHVDLPDMLMLQSVYLSHFSVPNVKYINANEDIKSVESEYDLFLSNFAFTEISSDVQKLYFDNVIKKCRMGIVVGKMSPHIDTVRFNKLTKVQLGWFELNFNIRLEEHNPYNRGKILYFWKEV